MFNDDHSGTGNALQHSAVAWDSGIAAENRIISFNMPMALEIKHLTKDQRDIGSKPGFCLLLLSSESTFKNS